MTIYGERKNKRHLVKILRRWYVQALEKRNYKAIGEYRNRLYGEQDLNERELDKLWDEITGWR